MNVASPNHPAKFTDTVLEKLRELLVLELDALADEDRASNLDLPWPPMLLDPFAGVGGIHALEVTGWRTLGVELEPEWAAQHPRNVVGDATALPPDWAGRFDALVTSPCYGNRMADTYDGRDGSKRMTYRLSLGRVPSDGSSAVMQWGEKYRLFHYKAWHEGHRVLRSGGLALVNVSDHIRRGQVVPVVGWHARTLHQVGFRVERIVTVDTPRYGFGANRDLRVDGERIIVARRV